MTKNIVLCGWKSGVMVNTVTSQQKGPEFEANWGFFVWGLHVNRTIHWRFLSWPQV